MSDPSSPFPPSGPHAPPVYAPPTEPGPIPPPQAVGGMAVASMICGIVGLTTALFGFFCMISPIGCVIGLLGLIFGWISLAKRRPGGGMAWAGVITGALSLLVGVGFGVFLYTMISSAGSGVRAAMQNVQSINNANTIGVAMQNYAAANNNQFPPAGPGWEQAIAGHLDDPAATQQVGGIPAFIYLGNSTTGSDSTRIVLYENLQPQKELYAVLYADGHVETKSRAEIEKIIADLPAKE